MPTDDFISQTAGLRCLGGQRVWSLMISLFGDLARDEGQAIDGPVLSAIMQGLDVKAEAARVALHRLRKDGWLKSEKSGRISRHSLTAEGRAQSAAASPRIYADPTNVETQWQVVIQPDSCGEGDLMQGGFVMVAPRIFVGPLSATPPQDALSLPGQDAPQWLIAQTQPEELIANYTELLNALSTLQITLPQTLSPLNTAILRCLIVHNWRRLVLKHSMLPAPLIDPAWVGHECHLIVWDMLGRFPRPSLADLEKQRTTA